MSRIQEFQNYWSVQVLNLIVYYTHVTAEKLFQTHQLIQTMYIQTPNKVIKPPRTEQKLKVFCIFHYQCRVNEVPHFCWTTKKSHFSYQVTFVQTTGREKNLKYPRTKELTAFWKSQNLHSLRKNNTFLLTKEQHNKILNIQAKTLTPF